MTKTAEMAIEELKNTNGVGFMGYEYARVLPTHIRMGLREMLEAGQISGKEFWRASKITFSEMSDYEKNLEVMRLESELNQVATQ